MNIFQQYGIKEVADVCLYAIELDENDDEVYVPVLYLDTLKVSTVEQTSSNVSAQGGLGNPKLITWDYNKEITLNLEDALFTPASQGIMWHGEKNGIEKTTLYLRNFWDRALGLPSNEEIQKIIEQHPEWSELDEKDKYAKALADWLNKNTTNATLTIENFSDFCIIPERIETYENKYDNGDKKYTGYVGNTSIYCWLVDATISSLDAKKKIFLDDLILFYREQTQKWYFFNGADYKYKFDLHNINRYAVGYQYGKDTFEWIKEHLANGMTYYRLFQIVEDHGISGDSLALSKYGLKNGFYGDFFEVNEGREKKIDTIVDSEQLININVDNRNFMRVSRKGSAAIHVGDDLIEQEYSLPLGGKRYDFTKIPSNDKDFTPMGQYNDSLTAIKYGFLYSYGIVELMNDIFIISGENVSIDDKINSIFHSIRKIDGVWYLIYNGFQPALDYQPIDENSYYELRIKLGRTKEQIYNTVMGWMVYNTAEVGHTPSIPTEESAIEYEPVAIETLQEWQKKLKNNDYKCIPMPLSFLTQALYIDGLKVDSCTYKGKYSDDIYSEVYVEEPCRFEASIDLEYNTNIIPPQYMIHQADYGLNDVYYLDRIEKYVAEKRFCIDTDVNLKHGECRYLSEYYNTPLTVFIDPNTMKPYQPNIPYYYRDNGQRITGNLRAFNKGEVYYKWTRSQAKRNHSLGKQIIIDAMHFPGTYRLVGETYIRDRDSSRDARYQLEIPLCKMSADTRITLQADSEPTTFSMKLTALKKFDDSLIKLTMYDVDEDKEIVQNSIRPEFEPVNALWDAYTEAEYNIDLNISTPEIIDLASIILEENAGLAKTDSGDINE